MTANKTHLCMQGVSHASRVALSPSRAAAYRKVHNDVEKAVALNKDVITVVHVTYEVD